MLLVSVPLAKPNDVLGRRWRVAYGTVFDVGLSFPP